MNISINLAKPTFYSSKDFFYLLSYKTISIFSIILFSLLFSSENVFALDEEPILITSSLQMEKVIFDGKWTFPAEWKASSLNEFTYDGMRIILRSAHQDNFIYFYVDVLSDQTFNKGSDNATICIDGKNNKNLISDHDDFCFSSTLGNKQGVVFQGGSINAITGNFEKIPNPENFIGLGNISDENNRYTKEPHVSYEFKIPIYLIERSDNYGFFLSVYDASSQSFYTWPYESLRENFFQIPSPNTWGDIVSPDKSLPELSLPLIVLIISIFTIIIVQFRTPVLIKRF